MNIGPMKSVVVAFIFAVLVVIVSALWLGVKPVSAPPRDELRDVVPVKELPAKELPIKESPVQVPVLTPRPVQNNPLATTTIKISPNVVTSGTKSVALNESFEIMGGYTLRITKIIEDSRCKPNVQYVQCKWAGRLVVDMRIDSKMAEPKVRNIEIQIGQGTVLNGYNITLTDYVSNKFIFKIEAVQK